MKHTVSALLLSALLLSLAACGEAAQNTPGTENGEKTDTDAQTAVTEAAVNPNVPDTLDLGGRPFVILACDESVPYTYIEDPAQDGDVMNDAIYTRNRQTEEYLNTDLQVYPVKGINLMPTLSKDIMAGGNAFDLMNPHILQSINAYVSEGYLYDLNALDYLDFSAPWWIGQFGEAMSIKGKTFYCAGDLIAANARIIVFNKQMMADNDLPDIYKTITDGKWTLDTMAEYCRDMVKDLNGDGAMGPEDQYAFSDLSNTGLSTSFVHASGALFVEHDAQNGFAAALDTEKMNVIINKLYDTLYAEGNLDITNDDFSAGRVLFGSQVFLKLQMLRDSQTEFGIIPFPKYDEAQRDYYSSMWNGLVCIPTDAVNAEESAAVLESMAYFSHDTLVPAYYSALLGEKMARDENSVRMLDIIFNGLVYDPGLCYDNFMGCYSALGTLLKQKSTDLSSFAAQNDTKFNTEYKKLFDSVEG